MLSKQGTLAFLITSLLSFNTLAFYCADGTAKFRVEFSGLKGEKLGFSDLKDGKRILADMSNATDMEEVTFLNDKKQFEAVVSLSSKSKKVFISHASEEFEDLFQMTINPTPIRTMTIGGSWHDPNSGTETPVYSVLAASYYTDYNDGYVTLNDLYEKSMDCWKTGGPSLESVK